ncbi:MAG TPA: hypothetical protein VG498_14365 [Terriglobales bacterium]|nr:hypothetical protein [Terriglobales bacterium]
MKFAKASRVGTLAVAFLFTFFSLLPALSDDGSSIKRRLTNQDIIAMVSSGISEDVILTKIRATSAAGSSATNFDTSVEGLKTLKGANVPDAVIKAMIDPTPTTTPTVVAVAAPTTLGPNLPPPEVGVYWKNGSNFVLLQGQAISQSKVGGKAANVFTYGIKGVHWDAFINGQTSNNRVKELRPTFYFYVPDGASASDYVLLKLNRKGDRREFEIGTFGGWLGGRSGVDREKELPFNSEHVGIRIYKVSLGSDLKPGEYAFFMGTGQQSATAGQMAGKGSGGATTGRVYDFTIPE